MKWLIFLIIFSLLFSCGNADKEGQPPRPFPGKIWVSEDAVEMLAGMHDMSFVSAIVEDYTKLDFQLKGAPGFVRLDSLGPGDRMLSFDPGKGQTGSYSFVVVLTYDGYPYKRALTVSVRKMPERARRVRSEKALREALDVAKEGEVILLEDGDYGNVTLSGHFGRQLRIATAAHAHPEVKGLRLEHAANIWVSGLEVIGKNEDTTQREILVYVDSTSEDNRLTGCYISSGTDAERWTGPQWKQAARHGVVVEGDHCNMVNNFIQYTYHAIETKGDSNQCAHNTVDRFGGDALRNTGNFNHFEGNLLKNATVDDYAAPDGNHDDLYQSWTFGPPIVGTVIRGNLAISCSERGLANKSTIVQGIACFDGFAEGWTIEGNEVILDHPHGIALLGARNCKILNNIVKRNPLKIKSFESLPWIMVAKHKDGRPSSGNLVQGNVAAVLRIDTLAAEVVGNSKE